MPGNRSSPEAGDLSESEEWQAYLDRFIKAYNALPELPTLLEAVAPLIFQYNITDRPEMNWWQKFEKDMIRWGMGENAESDVPKVVHKTDFATMKKVTSGELDPVSATMMGKYSVDGDLGKLMASATLLPLNPKAHAIASSSQ